MEISKLEGIDLLEHMDGNDRFLIASRSRIEKLREEGFLIRVDEEETELLRRSRADLTFLDGYRTVEETRDHLQHLAAARPNLAQYFTYGQSWKKTRNAAEGYDLFGIKLTNTAIPGSKPTFFLEAGIHSRELVPPEIAVRFADYLLKNYGVDADVTWLLNEHTIVIIPFVNPDGRKLAELGQTQRKNLNNLLGTCANPPTDSSQTGIDLNRNFLYQWGVINGPSTPPCNLTFPGPTAASEPETTAIQNLLLSIFPDQRGPLRTDPAPPDATGVFLDMHSYGNLVLYPWGQDATPPPNLQLATIARKAAFYNGYNPIQSINLYATSGTAREFAYGELGVAGLAMEIGLSGGSCGGFFPPYTCLDGGTGGNFWNLNRPTLLYLAKIARMPYTLAEGPTPETATIARNPNSSFLIRSQLNEVANGGQNIASASLYIDTPPWRGGVPVAMAAEDGSFNSPVEFATATIQLTPGRHIIYLQGRDAANNPGAVKAVFSPSEAVKADFDGDGRTDISISRINGGAREWWWVKSTDLTVPAVTFGLAGDIIATADFTGDGKTDIAQFRPSTGQWFVLRSEDNSFFGFSFGVNGDIPAPADYDGDGKADAAVYRPSSGTWYVFRSSDNQVSFTTFGAAADKPAVADFDGDGKADISVWKPNVGQWWRLNSSNGSLAAYQFGAVGDKPVQGDYTGDGKADIAIFRPSSNTWFVLRSEDSNFFAFPFGAAGDIPAPGDYDGDGKFDAGVFRPSQATWFLNRSTAGSAIVAFGVATDTPIPSAYIP